MGRKGSFGKINYSDRPVFAIDTTYFIDERSTSENIRWLYFVLKSLGLDEVSKDSAVPGLSRVDAYSRVALAPPLSEQAVIASYLDQAASDIDAAIAHANQEIELLDEYRTRLVADVVTGKLDVREAAAALPEVDSLAAEG